jgi:hypothetical protein
LQEAAQAARQLNSLWLVRRNAKLLQEPHTEISPALTKLLHQSERYAVTICDAFMSCSGAGHDSKPQQQALLRAVHHGNVAKVLAQLLKALCCQPETAAAFTQTDGNHQPKVLCAAAMLIWSELLVLATATGDHAASLELLLLAGTSGW